jgi:hypothetical protein
MHLFVSPFSQEYESDVRGVHAKEALAGDQVREGGREEGKEGDNGGSSFLGSKRGDKQTLAQSGKSFPSSGGGGNSPPVSDHGGDGEGVRRGKSGARVEFAPGRTQAHLLDALHAHGQAEPVLLL